MGRRASWPVRRHETHRSRAGGMETDPLSALAGELRCDSATQASHQLWHSARDGPGRQRRQPKSPPLRAQSPCRYSRGERDCSRSVHWSGNATNSIRVTASERLDASTCATPTLQWHLRRPSSKPTDPDPAGTRNSNRPSASVSALPRTDTRPQRNPCTRLTMMAPPATGVPSDMTATPSTFAGAEAAHELIDAAASSVAHNSSPGVLVERIIGSRRNSKEDGSMRECHPAADRGTDLSPSPHF